jgi:hypothetical protein
MPETLRVLACVEAPLRPRRGWRLGLLPGVLHALERGGADLPMRHVLQFPGQAFRAQLRLSLDAAAGFLLHLPREAPGGPTGVLPPRVSANGRAAVARGGDPSGHPGGP